MPDERDDIQEGIEPPANEPVETNAPDRDLDQLLSQLESQAPPLGFPAEQPLPEPPQLGDPVPELPPDQPPQIPAEQTFVAESFQIPPEAIRATESTASVPEVDLSAQAPDSLLGAFERAVASSPALAKEESLGIEALAGGSLSGLPTLDAGGGIDPSAIQRLMDADFRSRSATADMLVDHARRVDELTEYAEGFRL